MTHFVSLSNSFLFFYKYIVPLDDSTRDSWTWVVSYFNIVNISSISNMLDIANDNIHCL